MAVKVRGTVWVVTGGGGGIGRELVLELLRRGARVAAVDVREDALRETASIASAGSWLSTHAVDITDAAGTQALVGAVVDAHASVDGLVNNAGIIQPFLPFVDLDDAAIQRVLDVNLMGTIHMVKAFLPELLGRPQAHLVNVSSMGGVFPFPGQTMYGASKAAVKLLTEGLYAELLDSQVRVSVVIPGPVSTGIAANSGVQVPGGADAGRQNRMPLVQADAAARMVVDGIERDKLHIYLGPVALLASLAIRVAPRRAIQLVQKQTKKMLGPPQPTPVR